MFPFQFHLFDDRVPEASPSAEVDALIVWDSTMSVGNALIDGEHREIIALLNRIYRDWRYAEHRLDVGRMLARLTHLVETHFANEEEILARHRCPRLGEHAVAHKVLARELAAIRQECGTIRAAETEVRLLDFIRRLIMDHVLTVDQDLKSYMH